MPNDDGRAGGGLPGACILITAMAVLALLCFAALSLSAARADERLFRRQASAEADWQAADREASLTLARILSGETPDGVERSGDTYSYRTAIDGDRTIESVVEVDGENYEILSWRTVRTRPWTPDDGLEVLS